MQILKYPHPALRHKAKPLRRVDAELKRTIREMFDLMYQQRGIGLAANQVGLPYRLVVINTQSDPPVKESEWVLINPVVLSRSGMAEEEEGCLSLPEIYAPVRRPERVKLAAYDLSGEEVTWDLDGLLARAAQHECDHLDGILFVDRVSAASQLAVKEKLENLQRQFASDRARGQIPDDDAIAFRLAELEQMRT